MDFSGDWPLTHPVLLYQGKLEGTTGPKNNRWVKHIPVVETQRGVKSSQVDSSMYDNNE